MDTLLQAQMLAERCQMYLRHLRGVVYLLNMEAMAIRPGILPPDWRGLMEQITHLAEATEREVQHYHQLIKENSGETVANDTGRRAKAA